MPSETSAPKYRHWLVPIAVSLAVHLLAVLFVRLPPAPAPPVVEHINARIIRITFVPAARPQSRPRVQAPRPRIPQEQPRPRPVVRIYRQRTPRSARALAISQPLPAPSVVATTSPVVAERSSPVPDPVTPVPATPAPIETLAASPVPVAHGAPDGSVWAAAIAARLQTLQRYPPDALASRVQGTVFVLVSIDRNGAVVATAISHSSGARVLDTDAVTLIERAAPLPAPPAALIGDADVVQVAIPVRYAIQPSS